MDAALPFGLRSAPKIFTALADAIEWIAKSQGVQHLWHYLDDFVICGEPDSEQCHLDLESLIAICNHLGVPLALEKVEGPTVCLVFLGILIDTNAGELSPHQNKSSLYFTLNYCTLALLHSTTLYINLLWLYFTPLDSALLYHSSNSLYLTLHYST